MQSSELIVPLAIQTPICVSGDKNIPSQNAQGTDTSSINLGFLPITSEPLDDGGQAPERIDFNGMFYLATDQRVFLQNGGFITYSSSVASAIGGYPKGAVLAYLDNSGNFNFVESEIENNQYNFITNPAYINGTYWSYRNVLKDLSNISQNITSIPPTALTNFDGQWVSKTQTLSTSTSINTYTINLGTSGAGALNYLPADNNKYMVYYNLNVASKSNNYTEVYINGDIALYSDSYASSNVENKSTNGFFIVDSTRTITFQIAHQAANTVSFTALMYRRIGTNS